METYQENGNIDYQVIVGGHTFYLWGIAENGIYENKIDLMDSYLLKDFRQDLIELITIFSDEIEEDLSILEKLSDNLTIYRL